MTGNEGVRPTLQAVLIAVPAFAAMLILINLPLFSLLELKGLDLLFRMRGPLAPPGEIVVVAIDEPSFAEIMTQWPWPRRLHARLIEQLKKAGARVIAFDILFAEPSQPEEDRALAQAIHAAGNVVLAGERSVVTDALFRQTILVDPIELFKATASVGIATLPIDPDGIVRRPLPFSNDLPSFASQIVRLYQGQAPYASQTDSSDTTLINYFGPPRTVKTISYYQALEADRMLPSGTFTDKIVLVGRAVQAAPEPQRASPDVFPTPFSFDAGGPTAGVEIHATIVANLLTKQMVTEPPGAVRYGLLFLLALIGSLSTMRLKPLWAAGAILGLSILFLLFAFGFFTKGLVWLPIFAGMVQLGLVYGGYLIAQVFSAQRERRLALEAMNRELEQKVKERTAQYVAANEELVKEQHELEKTLHELAQTQNELLQSEKMASLGFLVAGVAHELNNPISFVHSNMDFIGEYVLRLKGVLEAYETITLPDGPAYQQLAELKKGARLDRTLHTLDELITSCKRGTERVKRVVLDLGTFARADDVDPAPADLHEGLEITLNLLAKEYRDRITVHREYGTLPQVECHAGQINQVFMNLLLNAAQAIPETGDVWINTSSHGDKVVVIIKDNGCGIPEANLPRIFDPFFTTKKVGEGMGLGLSISYGIIQKHGGNMRVSSPDRQGTEFTIELPVKWSGTK
ncbi:Multi-sensor signal transduction histidine kinase [Candidatus Methylomirabilis lanthanidiphila]|uniref:histidine kinase n=1 Tax=Candidatus Methylomirabilis lanthanidiphila TaxID=2211376 RepID=A0A564ZFZ4_9BACT|nr:CHASE2 domain-containing protein [Candidatus Methylomirabilis lanthanidiphila]VUZ84204.1 Multi-sensor signal transduction histidine kinase [Candidatus Methylomirabilis lanthanidiphila]